MTNTLADGTRVIEGPTPEGRAILSERSGVMSMAEEARCFHRWCGERIYRLRCERAMDLYGGAEPVAVLTLAPCGHYPATPMPDSVTKRGWRQNYNATSTLIDWYLRDGAALLAKLEEGAKQLQAHFQLRSALLAIIDKQREEGNA